MVNLDMLLTLVGMALLLIGVGVFLFGRKRPAGGDGHRNVFEAFGIKLDVANPSILLIMFGVVMMLTPRFVPLEQVAAEALPPVEFDALSAQPDNGSPGGEATPTVPSGTLSQQAAEPAAAVPVAVEETPMPAAMTPSRVTEVVASAPVQTRSPPPPVPAPEAAPAPLRLAMITAAGGRIEGVDAVVYKDKMKRALNPLARELVLGEVSVSGANPPLRHELKLRSLPEFCRRWQVDRVLYAEVEPSAVDFGIESGNWPEASFAVADCNESRLRESKIVGLSPTQGDGFPFQQSLERAARDFFESHRGLFQNL